LHYCLEIILKLLAPITPFITYKIYHTLTEKDIHIEEFPKHTKEYKVSFTTEDIIALNSGIWKAKKDKNLSLKSPIKELTLPEKFKGIERDLVSAHNVERVGYGEGVEIVN
jgi:valyl-tRNA synthetase